MERGDAPTSRRLALIAMTAGLSIVFIDQTAVSVALPSIQEDFGATQAELSWVVNAFMLSLAALVAVGGRLGDLAGKRRVLLAGVVVFALASLACGLAQSEGMLIAARALQGVGGAAMMPMTTAIVVDAYPEAERGRAMGIYIGAASMFLSLGPLAGGILTELIDWRAIFFINLPVAVVVIALTRASVPAASRRFRARELDWPAIFALGGGLTALVLALMQGPDWGWSSPATIGLLVAAAVLLALLPRLEARREMPLVSFPILEDRPFLGAISAVLTVRFAIIGALVFSAIYLQLVLGYGPLSGGVLLLPATIPMVVMAPIGGVLTDRIGARLPTAVGMVIVAASLVALALLLSTERYAVLWPALIGFGAGVGLVTASTSTAGMNVAAAADRGEAAGLISTIRQVGGTLGLAVMTAVITGVQQHGTLISGLRAGLLVAAGVCLVGGLVSFALLREPIRK